MDAPLSTYGTVTLDASGYGMVSLSPSGMVDWRITRIAVRTSQGPMDTPVPTCTVYLGTVSDGDIIDQTWTGSRDVSDCDVLVQHGTSLITVWEGGVPGSSATVSLYGSQGLRR